MNLEMIIQFLIFICATSWNIRFVNRQGLFFMEGNLYESSGLYEHSKIMKHKIEKNLVTRVAYDSLPRGLFGEGSDFFLENGRPVIYMVIWEGRVMLSNKIKI